MSSGRTAAWPSPSSRVTALGVATMFDRALAGANLAPVAGGDPAPAWLAERDRRWRALQAWFAPDRRRGAAIAGLLDIARTAIIELLRVLERRWDSRRRSASVANDFRRLADVFAAAPGDAEAHRLFGAAFGLWPARHAHLATADGEARAPTTSWREAGPVDVAPALRTTGYVVNTRSGARRGRPCGHPGRPPARASRGAGRPRCTSAPSLMTDGAVAPLDVRAACRRPSSTSCWPCWRPGSTRRSTVDGARRALSADGRVEVSLRDPHDRRTAELHTDRGRAPGP